MFLPSSKPITTNTFGISTGYITNQTEGWYDQITVHGRTPEQVLKMQTVICDSLNNKDHIHTHIKDLTTFIINLNSTIQGVGGTGIDIFSTPEIEKLYSVFHKNGINISYDK